MSFARSANIVAVCFSILSMLSQSVYALSAPCPMLHELTQTSLHDSGHAAMDHDMMNHQTMNHQNMDHASILDHSGMGMSSSSDTCCGDGTCPMNACASAVLLHQPIMVSAVHADTIKAISIASNYLSVQTNHLYRPPISR
jgi:uncharacterized protein involved in copper resistance